MSGAPSHVSDLHSNNSPLRGRYLASDWRLRTLLAASDVILAPLQFRRGRSLAHPRRILMAINGHLGDAVIASAAVELLAGALPDAELGMLLPSWSRAVFEDDPRVRRLHTVDHWHTSRARVSARERWSTYRRSRRRAIAEIRAVGYDAAVDLYDYFPNAALLLWRAGIPVRVGFDAAGFSALYTHRIRWPDDDRHTAHRQQILLRALLPASMSDVEPQPTLAPAQPETVARVAGLLDRHGVGPDAFTVLHPGAGVAEKGLDAARWRQIAVQLSADGETVVLTGRGGNERALTSTIARDLPRCIDLCDALAWAEYVQLVRLARRVIALDSVAGHVASAVGTPSITLWTSSSRPQHWRPLGAASHVLDGRSERLVEELSACLSAAPLPVR
jgi:ADP-heptose:LPS heptosyltransferase